MTPTATEKTTKTTITTPKDREIHIERIVNASRDRVWRAYADPAQVAQWWGRGNTLVVERMEFERGGHWRYVEHTPNGVFGFEGRYREVKAPERFVRSFEWDGMPGHVAIESLSLEDLGDGRTKIVITMQMHTPEERDGFLNSGMQAGMDGAFAALDKLLGVA
jgi:uncharacterized protein YndB with AHSA1/START domain